jgi:plastocyanin
MTKLLALILACLALGLAACGGDDDDGGGGGGGGGGADNGGAAETSGGGGDSGGGTEVSLESVQFEPEDLTVKAGETITFTNNESIPHDVHKTSGPGEDFASGPSGGMQEGDTFELTLDQPGKYEYVCDVHAPGMAGTITVE